MGSIDPTTRQRFEARGLLGLLPREDVSGRGVEPLGPMRWAGADESPEAWRTLREVYRLLITMSLETDGRRQATVESQLADLRAQVSQDGFQITEELLQVAG